MTNTPSIRTLLDNVLTILHVENDSQRERMIDELEQVIQTKVMLLSLQEIPRDQRQKLSELSPKEVKDLLQQHIGEAIIQKTLAQATEEIIPGYVAELAETATEREKEKIEKLLQSVV